MKKKINRKRNTINLNLKLTLFIVGLFFCVIIVKLTFVVVSSNVDGIDLTKFAENRNTTKETLYANRGIIYDVNGKPLAKMPILIKSLLFYLDLELLILIIHSMSLIKNLQLLNFVKF